MNSGLWVLQILLALHTAMGGVWKFSNSEQAVPTLQAIPHGVWVGLGALELLIAAALVVPLVHRPLAMLGAVAAASIAVEMLAFAAVHLAAGATDHGSMIYWLVVAALCGFLVYGRLTPSLA